MSVFEQYNMPMNPLTQEMTQVISIVVKHTLIIALSLPSVQMLCRIHDSCGRQQRNHKYIHKFDANHDSQDK